MNTVPVTLGAEVVFVWFGGKKFCCEAAAFWFSRIFNFSTGLWSQSRCLLTDVEILFGTLWVLPVTSRNTLALSLPSPFSELHVYIPLSWNWAEQKTKVLPKATILSVLRLFHVVTGEGFPSDRQTRAVYPPTWTELLWYLIICAGSGCKRKSYISCIEDYIKHTCLEKRFLHAYELWIPSVFTHFKKIIRRFW